MSPRPVAAVRMTMVNLWGGNWRLAERNSVGNPKAQLGDDTANRSALNYSTLKSQKLDVEWHFWMQIIWIWPKIWTRSNSRGVNSLRDISLWNMRHFSCVSTCLLYVFSSESTVWSFIFPVFPFCADLRALSKYKSSDSANSSSLQEHSRDVIAVQIMPRGSKNSRWGWLFSDQINGTLKCLLKRSKSMGGRRERVLEAFLWLHRGTPEDQGNEIGQWKECFDKFCLKHRCCFLACRQRVWRDVTLTPTGRQTTYSYRPKYRISPAVVIRHYLAC